MMIAGDDHAEGEIRIRALPPLDEIFATYDIAAYFLLLETCSLLSRSRGSFNSLPRRVEAWTKLAVNTTIFLSGSRTVLGSPVELVCPRPLALFFVFF